MTTTLTDRYVSATLRRVPQKQRPEIEKELRAAIADDVDARLAQGDAPDAAEHAALVELGDPYRLAASYTNRSLALIGPDIYPTYIRTLKVVCWIALPIVVVALAAISIAQGKNVFASIFGPLGAAISVGIYISFIITLVFVILERTQPDETKEIADRAWTPDALVAEIEPPSLTKWGDVVSQTVGSVLLAGFLVFDRLTPFVPNRAGRDVPILDQHLWGFWIPLYLVLLGLAIVYEFLKLRVGRWNVGTRIASTVFGLIGAGALIAMVLTTTVVNPALVSVPVLAVGSWLWTVVSIVIGVIWLGVTVNLWRPSAGARRPE
jgi:hypothetical protein